MKRTIFVGLSGGVDSSLAASLLLEAGESVVGTFIKIDVPEIAQCTWREDRLAAKRTAATLGIPFVEYDLSEAHRQSVIEYMVNSYKEGHTPNPDTLCNRSIKFGALWDLVSKDGATHLATGHYARIEAHGEKHVLKKGIDPSKDQSYFLWQLTQDDLSHAIFPLGGFTKDTVRHMARERNLPSAKRKDSQGLCFIGDISLGEFLDVFIEQKQGDVLDTSGNTIGTHTGAAQYTIGQRHGFSLHHTPAKPCYVIARDTIKNTIVVSEDVTQVLKTEIPLNNVSWVRGTAPWAQKLSVALRYHGGLHSARLRGDTLVLDSPALAVSGQSAVLYDGDECLGGGEIL